MKGILSSFLMLATGAAIGSVVTWKLVKDKYARIAQEEIDSMRAYFLNRLDELTSDGEDEVKDEQGNAYAHFVSDLGYAYGREPEEDADPMTRPCVIAPEELGECEDYEIINLTYYSDGVLTDDVGEPVEDVDFCVGADFAEHFGEHEPDSVHVRNDERKIYYEILKDNRAYTDVVNFNPFSAEDE